MAIEAEMDELLAALESAGSGLAVLELPRDTALTGPVVTGVATLLPLSGTMYILRQGSPPRRVRAGELALVPPGVSVRLTMSRSTSKIVDSRAGLMQRGGWLVVPAPRGQEPVTRVAAARIIGSRTATLRDIVVADVSGCDIGGSLFRQLAAEVERGEEGHAGFAMALMNACVVHAIRRSGSHGPVRWPPGKAVARGAVARAIAAIRACPGDRHSVDSLAALAGMSRSSFLRGFARATGTAPQRYLQQVRLEEAAALLGSTALPIKAVAAAVGFLSRSHFSRSFDEAFGMDPTAYRRKILAE